MLADRTAIPHKDVLLENIVQRLFVNHVPLQLFVVASYDYEVNELTGMDLNLYALNASQIHDIYQVLLRCQLFDRYTPLRRCMTALIRPAGTDKTQTIMPLIVGMYCMLDDGGWMTTNAGGAIQTKIYPKRFGELIYRRYC